jgi:hypothetical protein
MEDFGAAALREALAGSPLGNFIQQYIPNPYLPLAFERYSGAADNNSFPCDSNVEIGACEHFNLSRRHRYLLQRLLCHGDIHGNLQGLRRP